jgi:hypothetical protein
MAGDKTSGVVELGNTHSKLGAALNEMLDARAKLEALKTTKPAGEDVPDGKRSAGKQ